MKTRNDCYEIMKVSYLDTCKKNDVAAGLLTSLIMEEDNSITQVVRLALRHIRGQLELSSSASLLYGQLVKNKSIDWDIVADQQSKGN